MGDLSPSTKGALAEFKAITWLAERGYEVFRNVTPDGPVDLVAVHFERGETILIDVKMASIWVGKASERRFKNDYYEVKHKRLTERQKALGVRLLLVLDDFIGWEDEHPLKMLDGLVQSHYAAKKQAKSAENPSKTLDIEQDVIS